MGGLETVLPRISVPLVYRLGDPKPGAETWIEAQGGSAAGHPVLIVQRYGQGRTMLLASDGLWQLAMREGGARTESPSARFWLQILNWLAQVEDKGDENDPVLTASADRSFYVSEQEVHLSATLRKPPRDGMELAVRGEVLFEGESLALLQFPEPNAVRRAELTWKPPHDGRFVFRLTGQAGDAEQTLDIEACVGRPFAERERNALNETTLRTMARESGGRYYTQLNARDVVGQIEADTASATKLVELDLLDSPAVFAAFCLAVCLEWILRRRRNLI
ncbi:MAG: hypothetical protein BWZ10_02406 [candidate division BRC1 bacterium ADurb.BinA364]|nr:MAG: hypothetical protein BWZ10_02406 [candidate division BRC1 bacterium ADurb.BinA364]